MLTCPFLFYLPFCDCRLALIVSNFLGALRQTHQHLKGKQIIPHYYSSAFYCIRTLFTSTTDAATLLPKPGEGGVSSAYAVFILSLSNLAVGQLINSTASGLHQHSILAIPCALWHTNHLALAPGFWYLKTTLNHYS